MARRKADRSVSDIISKINSEHGDDTIRSLNDNNYDIERIPTGIMSLDHILSGGLPRGKMAIAWGIEGGGKSATAIQFAGQAQKFGTVVYIDFENALDREKAENSGVNLDDLLISQPPSGEKTFEVIEDLVQTNEISAIIVDSVAAMATEAEIAGDYGDAHVAQLARLLSSSLKKLNTLMNDTHSQTILFFINQQRENVGGYGPMPQKTTPGGKALRYYSSTTMEVARTGNIKQGEEIIGQTSQVTLKKSRFSPPFQKASFDIYFDSGISNESTILDLAVKMDLVKKATGGHYADAETGEKIGHGKPKAIAYMKENPEYSQKLAELVLTTGR